MPEANLILLSGGKSSRMGQNKALLPVAGKANILRILDELRPAFNSCILVTNHPEAYRSIMPDIDMVPDLYPGLGPLAGIHAGLKASTSDCNLVVACDMPFVSKDLASFLVNQIADYDAVVPRLAGRNQPLFAVYRKRNLSILETCLEEQMLRVNFFLTKLNVHYLDETALPKELDLERIFFNMNHPEEYEQVQKWASEKD